MSASIFNYYLKLAIILLSYFADTMTITPLFRTIYKVFCQLGQMCGTGGDKTLSV